MMGSENKDPEKMGGCGKKLKDDVSAADEGKKISQDAPLVTSSNAPKDDEARNQKGLTTRICQIHALNASVWLLH